MENMNIARGRADMKIKEFQSHKEITTERKLLFYGGTALMVTGFILFLIPFFSVINYMNQGNFAMMNDSASPATSFIWAVIGMVLLVIGRTLRSAGARGLAGSGLVLDPQRAKEELSTYSEAVGGMVRDAVNAFEKDKDKMTDSSSIIKVRCHSCRALNDEDAAYCKSCGKPL